LSLQQFPLGFFDHIRPGELDAHQVTCSRSSAMVSRRPRMLLTSSLASIG
jgi:hypothetical protein